MEREFVAQRVANRLFKTEASIDHAIADLSGLMTVILAAQEELGISRTVADTTVAKLAAAITAASEARTALTGTHKRLETIHDGLGLRTKLSGIQYKEQTLLQAESASETSKVA